MHNEWQGEVHATHLMSWTGGISPGRISISLPFPPCEWSEMIVCVCVCESRSFSFGSHRPAAVDLLQRDEGKVCENSPLICLLHGTFLRLIDAVMESILRRQSGSLLYCCAHRIAQLERGGPQMQSSFGFNVVCVWFCAFIQVIKSMINCRLH